MHDPTRQRPPGATPHPYDRVLRSQYYGREVNLMLDYLPHLPAPVLVPSPEGVHIVVQDVMDLEPWLSQWGGTVRVSPEWEGTQTWTLRCDAAPREGGVTVPVRVSVVTVAGTMAPPAVAAAVVQPPAPRPSPVRVEPAPLGAWLDVSEHVGHVLSEIGARYADDPEGVGERLEEIAALSAARQPVLADGAYRDLKEALDSLLSDLGGGTVAVYRPEDLAARLSACARPQSGEAAA